VHTGLENIPHADTLDQENNHDNRGMGVPREGALQRRAESPHEEPRPDHFAVSLHTAHVLAGHN
jgi:hypothetical protein